MSSINGIGALGKELEVAEVNKQSAVKKTDDSSTQAGLANALSKLNQMYASTGQNKATTGLAGLASLMGTDEATLTSELESGNSQKVSKLIAQQMEMSAYNSDSSSNSTTPSSGNLFDSQI